MSKKPVGRPTKYNPEYCDMLVEHMGEGLSFESFAGRVGVWKEAIYNWVEKYPEFSNAKKRGQAANLLELERMGLEGARGRIKDFNMGAWCFFMKNMHGWKDKHEHSIDEDDLKITINVK